MLEETQAKSAFPQATDVAVEARLDAAIRERATGERKGKPAMTCAQALELAETLQVEPARVGAACNRLGIKIMSCQLDCFS